MKLLAKLALVLLVLFVIATFFIGCEQKSHKKTQTTSNTSTITTITPTTNTEPDVIKNWKDLKPVYENSIATQVRTSAGGWPEDYLGQVSSFNEKEEIIRLWILSVDGSYSDCIIPGLGMYMHLFDQEITKAPSNGRRASLFKKEVTGLINILYTLDQQIEKYVDFSNQANQDFYEFLTNYLGKAPTDSDKVNNDYWQLFIENNYEYARPWPGFFSSQVEWQKDGRSYHAYHLNERRLLSSLEIPKELTLGEYKEFMKKIAQSRLGWAMGYKLQLQ